MDYRDPEDLTLGGWAERQRKSFREETIDPERLHLLLLQGFDFQSSPRDDSFTGDEQRKLKEWVQKQVRILD